MPSLQPRRLSEVLLEACSDSGSSAVLVSAFNRNPRRLIVDSAEGAHSVWAYCWTLTFGGRLNLPNEYRIQMTGVSSPLSLNPSGATVVLGYDPATGNFAAFDVDRHKAFTTGSPSVQIDYDRVREATSLGFSFDRKSNGELAIALRPDQFLPYVQGARALHHYGRSARVFKLLERASVRKTIRSPDMRGLSEPRKRVIRQVETWARASAFRQRVLTAYGHRCAVSSLQLKLVEAAHILPVGAPSSTDEPSNGIALAPTWHKAYDLGLIFFDTTYRVRINAARVDQFQAMGLGNGVDTLPEGAKLILPADQQLWPSKDFIREANRFRGVR